MGEMEKLEEVAKAIAGEDLDEGDGLYDWYALTDSVADTYRSMAKAAIKAMDNPTEAMLAAGVAVDNNFSEAAPQTACFWIYDAMIKAALKE